MRLWSGKRLYFCTACRSKFLISRQPSLFQPATQPQAAARPDEGARPA
jgi:hypothetical protein